MKQEIKEKWLKRINKSIKVNIITQETLDKKYKI